MLFWIHTTGPSPKTWKGWPKKPCGKGEPRSCRHLEVDGFRPFRPLGTWMRSFGFLGPPHQALWPKPSISCTRRRPSKCKDIPPTNWCLALILSMAGVCPYQLRFFAFFLCCCFPVGFPRFFQLFQHPHSMDSIKARQVVLPSGIAKIRRHTKEVSGANPETLGFGPKPSGSLTQQHRQKA